MIGVIHAIHGQRANARPPDPPRPQREKETMSWTVDPNHTQVEFSAKHMGIMPVKGHITGVQATIDFSHDDFTASSAAATIDPTTLTTNHERRDAHLKSPDFLDVQKFPTIAFQS